MRVILADDHTILREGLASLLRASPDIEVVAEAENGRETVRLARELEPDVVVMDVAMPDLNGVDATRKIARLSPRIKVLALSSYGDAVFVRGMLAAGAKGYLLKDAAMTELRSALLAVQQGRVYLSPSVDDGTIAEQLPAQTGVATSPLSAREREVLQLVAEGKSSALIADTLHLSERTIETHRKRIMDKLELRTVAELTKYAIREGITSLHV